MIAANRSGALATRAPFRAIVSLAAFCAVLAGCASSSDGVSADPHGTLTVSARATGGRLAWARAHKRALTDANDYCESRGMQTSFAIERTHGFQAFEQQDAVIRFECNPRL